MLFLFYFILFYNFSAVAETDCESLYLDVHKNYVLLLEAERQVQAVTVGQDNLEDNMEDNQNPQSFEDSHKSLVLQLEAERRVTESENKVTEAEDRLENSQEVYKKNCPD